MFKNIMNSQKRTALLYDAIEEVLSMLERAHRMFAASCSAEAATADAKAQMDKDDRDINHSERLVRRLIFQHLAVNPDQDLPTSMSLISIVHDVERLGDYAKNLAELSQWGLLCSGESVYAQTCQQLRGRIDLMFGQVGEALRESNSAIARQVMRDHEELKALTDSLVQQVMEEPDTGRMLILYVLGSRFLRRVSAHLSNVASSVVNPLDQVAGKEVREGG